MNAEPSWALSPDPTILIDRDSLAVLDCNGAAAALYARDRAEMLRLDYIDLLDNRDRGRGGVEPFGLAAAHRPVERHRRADGAVLHVLRLDGPAFCAGRAALQITLVDVTRRCEEAATVRREFAFLERVVRTIPAAVFVKDLAAGGRYVLCTGSTEDLANLPQNSVLGSTDAQLFSKQTADVFAETDREVVRTGKMVVSEDTICLLDGTIVVTETKKLPVPDEDGAPRYVLGISEDISQRREMERRLARVALHDSLTGLANRTLFRERLRAALTLAQKSGGLVVLHLLDLDHFKGVNDTVGHAAGDALLCEVSGRIETECGTSATVARLGGDEFAVIQGPVAHLEDATDLADRIRASLARPVEVGGRQLAIGASAGLAVWPDHGADPEMILRNADIALYGAKEQGRGTYRFFDAALATRVQLRHGVEEDLRIAMADGQFELFYQPIIDIADDQIVSFEALLRWHHPTRGLVPPAEFIPVAEDTGIIIPLGEWVLHEACRQAAQWDASIGVSVNLSPVQFRHSGLAASVLLALTASGLPPDRLELEITESVLLTNNEANLDTLHRLRALGIRISLDDFGTGYSSLGYLSAFPFNKIKIDRSFVQHIGSVANSLAIVRSVIRLADDLGMTATAEGVETTDQLDQLRSEGCTHAQGYLFDRPRPAGSLPAMMSRLRARSSAAAA